MAGFLGRGFNSRRLHQFIFNNLAIRNTINRANVKRTGHVKLNSATFRVVLGLATLSLVANAGDGRQRLQLVREGNLAAVIHEVAGAPPHSHSISQLKISEDDRWIAVDLVAGHRDGQFDIQQEHHPLVLPVNWKTGEAEQFDFEYRPQESKFFLSADAGMVAIEDGATVRIENRRARSSCSISSPSPSHWIDLGGFITGDLFVVTLYRPGHLENEIARYEVFDGNCKLRDSLDLSGGDPATASPQAGDIFLRRYLGGTRWDTELIKWPSWKLAKKWPYWARGLAADQGHVLCFESLGGGNRNAPVECRDLSNGAPLTRNPVVHDGYPLAIAASGTVAVGNDWFTMWKPFTEGDYWRHVKHQVLWDFRSGQVLASWVPKLQRDSAGRVGDLALTIQRMPFICALSHTGTLLLEGGDETIRISRILGK